MDLQLTGRTAFVSGSTQGVGHAIARALLAEGVTVVINGRHDDGVRTAVQRLQAEFPGTAVDGIAADFAHADQVQQLLDTLPPLDILVNNVGVFELRAFEDIADDDWQHYVDVNLMSAVRLSRHVLPGMLTRGWGRIVLVTSESGVDVPSDMIHYGVTKAAMLALGNGLAKRTRGTAVTVNSIVGGPTYSDGVARAVDEIARQSGIAADDVKASIASGRPTSLVQRFLEPDELASLALYLASPLSSATNGAALRADGGVLTTTI